MEKEFSKIIDEICKYYYDRGLPMEMLSDEIGISKRALQKWRSKGHRPHESNIKLLIEFLNKNNGGQFITRLNQVLGGYNMNITDVARGYFPDEMAEQDIIAIRNCFPKADEMSYLCAIIISGNRAEAISEVMPNGSLAQKAALISRYEASMGKCKDLLGIDGIYDWKDKVIQYIGQIPEQPGDVEALGQRALDNIISGYFENRRRTK